MIRRRAVLQGVRAARVFCDVASNRARELTRRVRGEVQTEAGDGLREIRVHYTGLHHGHAVLRVDLKDPVEARALDHDGAFGRERSTRKPGPRTARHEGHARCATGPDDSRDLRLVPREHDGRRSTSVVRQAVALVREQVVGQGNTGIRANNGLEGSEEAGRRSRHERQASPRRSRDSSSRPR